jgi:acetyltransferase
MKQKTNFKKLFKPKSVAVVGVSQTVGKVGYSLAKNIIKNEYSGGIYFVNPKYKKLFNLPCYNSLVEIPVKKIDCVIVAVPAKYVVEVVRQGSQKCKNFVVISAGFGEMGIEGHNQEMQLLNLAKEKDLTILGPNCLGFINPIISLNASFASGMPAIGSTAFISQSGALAVAMLDKAEENHLGFSQIISIGNKMQVDVATLIQYLATDKDTKVIAIYAEGINNGGKFIKAIQVAIKNNKQVIILKSGKTEIAQKAIALHTGSLAGSDDIFSAALEKAGAQRVNDFSELVAMVKLAEKINYSNKLAKPQLAIITNAGGPGVLATDEIGGYDNLQLASLSTTVKNNLKTFLPVAASVENPIDLLGDATAKLYQQAIEQVSIDENVNIILIILTPQDQTPVNEIAELIVEFQKNKRQLLVPIFIGGKRIKQAEEFFNYHQIIHFSSISVALKILAKAFQQQSIFEAKQHRLNPQRQCTSLKIINQVRNEKRNILYFSESQQLAEIYQLPISSFWEVTNGLKASLKTQYPCVAKIDAPQILHKTDRGGVILPIENNVQLRNAIQKLKADFPEEGARIIVQPLLPIKTELIIGMKKDPIFGPVIMVGLGGIYTEIFKLVDFLITPLSKPEIKQRLKHSHLAFLFQKTRGQEKYDLVELVEIIYHLSILATENPEILMIDINPLLIYNDGQPAVAVDFKVII